jgi:hypothetical protein
MLKDFPYPVSGSHSQGPDTRRLSAGDLFKQREALMRAWAEHCGSGERKG